MPPARRSGRRAVRNIQRLYVCTTCVRDLQLPPGESSRGQQLAGAVERRLNGAESTEALARRLHFLKVQCLSGCLSPCNVAFRATGKYGLRFSRLEPEDAPAILDFARAYLDHPTGDVPEDEWPVALRGKRTVRTPPPHLLLAGASGAGD